MVVKTAVAVHVQLGQQIVVAMPTATSLVIAVLMWLMLRIVQVRIKPLYVSYF